MTREPDLRFEFRAMGCACALRLAGAAQETLQRAARDAIGEIRRIEAKYSRYLPDSVVSLINAAAGSGRRVSVDEETRGLLLFAARLHEASGGLFDVTSGVLRRAWDFSRRQLPSTAEIEALLPRVGWHRVDWSEQGLLLPLAGMEIDFGGLGKEYAADRAAAVLHRHGLRHGYVNLGGDIRLIGPQPDGSGWRLGIQHPRRPGETIDQLELQGGALATSGDYERFMDVGGRRYCHLLDPRSGWPVGHWQSVSVVAPTCAAAGAASTLAMLMGPQGSEFLEREGLSHLAVRADGTLRRG